MPTRRLSRDEIGKRGSTLYQSELSQRFDSSDFGKFMAIDVETGEYEIADDAADASDQLWEKKPDAQVYVERIGYPASFHAYRSSAWHYHL